MTDISHMQVSVVVPSYNRIRTIERAVQSALDQTLAPVEILVVDDGSTDGTASFVERTFEANPKVKVLRMESNSGAPAARNRGIDAAVGDWVSFLDSDDKWRPRAIELMADRLASEGRSDAMTFGRFLMLREGAAPAALPVASPLAGESIADYVFAQDGHASTITFCLRKEWAQRVRFDERMVSHQDIDFAFRAERAGIRLLFVEDLIADVYREPFTRGDQIGFAASAIYDHLLAWGDRNQDVLSARAFAGLHVAEIAPRALRAGDYRTALRSLTRANRSVEIPWRGLSFLLLESATPDVIAEQIRALRRRLR